MRLHVTSDEERERDYSRVVGNTALLWVALLVLGPSVELPAKFPRTLARSPVYFCVKWLRPRCCLYCPHQQT